ncbi:hypothetical protein [Sphingomonas morindae]|uniref:Uncharacterized protein n=1 Tax=Sphingomonas morindae TaxID=1541170 RepID=A0ABY4X3W5_9SPHN|nr:hypothetical protein [Sphingomonas morindae]USI71603.1 hypothetical protein LHA26_09665 [Sphingomonas morindae]
MPELTAPAATASRAILGALARKAITIAGTALISHGLVDQGTVDAATGPIADYLVGAGLILASGAWSIARARITHTRFANAWRKLTSDAK